MLGLLYSATTQGIGHNTNTWVIGTHLSNHASRIKDELVGLNNDNHAEVIAVEYVATSNPIYKESLLLCGLFHS